MAFICQPCDRAFGAQESLQRHLLDSPYHYQYTCAPCKSSFKTQDRLEQHLQNAPRHKENQYCEVCDRYFNRVDSLQAHLRDVHTLQAARAVVKSKTNANNTNKTPLDRLFLSYPSFSYDPSLPPATAYKMLREHMAWPKGSPKGDRARQRYREALVAEVRVWFGDENDLTAWHTLCRAIGVQQPPSTVPGCESVVRNTHVNIVDLIAWGRAGGSESGVTVFKTKDHLRSYTIATEKYFPQNEVKNEKGETNIVLRHLLRKIFKPEERAERGRQPAVMLTVACKWCGLQIGEAEAAFGVAEAAYLLSGVSKETSSVNDAAVARRNIMCRTRDCTSSTDDNYCSDSKWCKYNHNDCKFNGGCGTLWLEECDGMCIKK
ncbi:hypothetical protein B0T14DRAFT_570443 [Immersiella caudata]|uniref:C2H2-type domain-containing protein n=1 Tax=Immersiella caudata TaxID=314043 RepID=A0AA40BUV3_9PEZI|nr:hypothetical protein B0T14DRAFT_570443 [Immersiella caudata]